MVLRLILDAVRRKWLMAAVAAFQLHILFPIAGKIWPSSEGAAWAMAGAWFLSIGAGDLFAFRELYQLPVSRRTWWLARWWLSVGGAVVVAQAAVSLAQWRAGSVWFGFEQAALCMTFSALYCGSAMGMQATSIGRWLDSPFSLKSTGWALLAILGFFLAPLVLARYLPHSFAEIDAPSMVVMLAMAAFTAVGYRYEPPIAPRPHQRLANRLPAVPAVPGVPGTAPAVEAPPTGFIGRLTGARMVLWEECRKQFFIFATVIAMGVAWWAIGSRFRPWPALGEVLLKAGVLPFSSPRAVVVEPIIFGALLTIANIADGWMASRIRSLRTLPLSSTQLGALPVALGLVCASMLWTVLLTLQALVVWTLPVSLRPDLFVACAALAAVMQTIRFVAPGQPRTKGLLMFVPVGVIWLGLGWADSWPADAVQMGMFLGGLLALAASVAVMHRAVTRSHAMYRPRSAVTPT